MVTIVDVGVGNLGSIESMLCKCNAEVHRTSSIAEIEIADRLILPGVGSFDNFMRRLYESGLVPILEMKVIREKVPIIGICLGMQILGTRSEEGMMKGLGWLDAEIVKFNFDGDQHLRTPHMGWNTVSVRGEHPLFGNIGDEPRFYFVHSYHMVCKDEADVIGTTHYGYEFASAVGKGNIYGTQFHPEKSHKYGMKLLSNFLEL